MASIDLCLNAWPIGRGALGKCGFVAVGMALMQEVCHFGGRFEVSYAQAMPSIGHSTLPDVCVW